jgi:hypothetical protein
MSEVYNFIPSLGDAIPDIPSNGIVSRTLHDDEGMKVIRFGFAEGQMLSERTASQPAMMIFVNGDVQLKLGDDTFRAQPGTWVCLPAHLSTMSPVHTPTGERVRVRGGRPKKIYPHLGPLPEWEREFLRHGPPIQSFNEP